MRFRPYQVALLVIFIVSVLIRIPNFDRPLSKHHEFNAAMVLVCMDGWFEKGPSYTAFTSVLSYTNPGDSSLVVESADMLEKKGLYSYTSFGSGWFIYPYLFFKNFHLKPSPLTLQIFNLILFLVSFVCCFVIAQKIFHEQSDSWPVKSLLTVFLFSFNPCVLWYFGNGYVHEVMVMPFFLLQVSLFIDIHRRFKKSTKHLFLYSLVSMSGVFCDWLCIFWMFVTFVYAVAKVRKDRSWMLFLIVSAFAAIFSIALIISHYGFYFGFKEYLNAMLGRYRTRGFSQINLVQTYELVLGFCKHFFSGYLSFIVLFFFVFIFNLIKRLKGNFTVERNFNEIYLFLMLIGVTGLLHHLVFPQFSSEHEYSVLKDSLFLSLLASGLILYYRSWLKLILIGLFIINILEYYYINPPGDVSYNGDQYDFPKKVGLYIRKHAQPDEVVFVDDYRMRVQMNYYAKRTTIKAVTLEEAKKLLKKQKGKTKGLWISIVDKQPVGISRFELGGNNIGEGVWRKVLF